VGAGDCFVGIFTLALVMGFNYNESAIIAFHSGLLYVQQKRRGMFGPWSFGIEF
jgi:fructose-1-phosphate kinase PfkB-like protein